MRFPIRKISNVLAILLGMVFLLSGFLKAMDAAAFSDLMGQYGFDWFGYGAPAIILFEVLLGLTLIMRIEVRYTALLSGLFLVSVTTIYTYGLFKHNMFLRMERRTAERIYEKDRDETARRVYHRAGGPGGSAGLVHGGLERPEL